MYRNLTPCIALMLCLATACSTTDSEPTSTSEASSNSAQNSNAKQDSFQDNVPDVQQDAVKTLTQAFEPCHDYVDADGNPDGGVPQGSPNLYRIISPSAGNPYLEAIDEVPKGQSEKVFTVVNENARFTTYKCWSSPDTGSQVSGFDAQLITELLAPTHYKYIRFTAVPWTTWVASPNAAHSAECADLLGMSRNDVEADPALADHFESCAAQGHAEYQLSMIAGVNLGLGHAAMAGMSINAERLGWAEMVGPIYKAGKTMVARTDNAHVKSKASSLAVVPAAHEQDLCTRYEPMRGLSVIEDATNIRGEFFLALATACDTLVSVQRIGISVNDGVDGAADPDAVRAQNLEAIRTRYQEIKSTFSEDKLTFIIVDDYPMIEAFVEAGMKSTSDGVFDEDVDLVMIDSGSAFSLEERNILGSLIEEVTGNISKDNDLGGIFGLGDGIAVTREDPETIALLTTRIKALSDEGIVSELVTHWFNDDNAADPSCIGRAAECL